MAKKKVAKKASSTRALAPLTPLHDKVVLKPLASEEKQRAAALGIELPESANKEKPEQGTVIAVGPGKVGDDNELIPVSVKVGDRVLFSKYGFDEVKVGGQEYLIVSESNILAVIN